MTESAVRRKYLLCQIRRISSKSINFTAFAEATLLSIKASQHSLTVRETFCLPFLLLIHFSKFEISEGTYITLKKKLCAYSFLLLSFGCTKWLSSVISVIQYWINDRERDHEQGHVVSFKKPTIKSFTNS